MTTVSPKNGSHSSTVMGVHFSLLGHDLHGLCRGPDGRLYFSVGDRGLHVETENGVLAYPDTGCVLRCEMDGTGLEVFATGLRNPQELVFDEFGYLFTGDNNSDGGDKARFVYLPEGADCGWRIGYQWIEGDPSAGLGTRKSSGILPSPSRRLTSYRRSPTSPWVRRG